MCGICGFIDKRRRLTDPQAVLRGMNDMLVHRGPDDAGYHVHENTALAMRRLSIIDIAGGHQPIHDETKTIWVVFNGEIYNFQDLRAELERAGHQFYTHTDTEVIVHAYQEYGCECFKKLHGMFAIALFDQQHDRLVLARDRAGKKPLYYSDSADAFVFGSELKAVVQYPGIARSIDPVALQQYLLCSCVWTPRSIFRGICKLPEASYVVIEHGTPQAPREYWRYEFADPPEKRPEGEWIELIDGALHRAVRRRLVADVPLGVFLSGGTDSSLVVAHMCRLLPPQEVKTFSITLDDPAYDESKWSRWAARLMQTDHHEFQLPVDSMIDVVDKVLGALDEPMGDSSLIPTYVVSELTRRHVTVALAGDAGDEIFGGYPKYFAQRWAAVLEKVPAVLRRWLLEQPLALLPSPDGSVLFGQNKVKAFFNSLHHHYALRNQFWVSPFLPDQMQELTGAAMLEGAVEPILRRAGEYRGPNDIVSRTQYLDFKLIMQDVFNVKVDRASMLASLEVREPFLDTEVVELGARMPSALKVKGMTTKYLLKKVATKYYPREFIYRKKWGFGIPVKRWIKDKLRARFEETLSTANVAKAGLVNPEMCQRLLREHLAGTAAHAAPLWNLYVLHTFYRKWVAGA